MQVWNGIDEVPGDLRASVTTIGNFDGVHLGHRPDDCPELLAGIDDRLALLAETGLDAVLVVRYDLQFAAQPPREFVRRYLVEALKVRRVVVGEDIRFGVENAGDRTTMREIGEEMGFAVDVVHDIESAGTRRRWSSTWVRELLAAGDVEQAAAVLGRPHRMRGIVVHGEARGRELGFPTANLAPTSTGTIPSDGVYAGWLVRRWGSAGAERLPAAISVGTNPTFDGVQRQVEAHVLGRTDLDLYDEEVVVEFTHHLRPTLRFDGIEPLIVQMHADVARAADLLGVPRPLA